MTRLKGHLHRAGLQRSLTFILSALCIGLVGLEVAPAQKITEIEVQYIGNARVAPGAIRSNMKTKVGQQLDADLIDEDVKNIDESGLVENVTFLREPHNGGVRLIVLVEARARLREVLFIGNSALSSRKLRGEIELAPGESWDDVKLAEARTAIMDAYTRDGYSNINVSYNVDSGEDGFSRITFSIDEGQRTVLDSIIFEGNTVFTDKELSSDMKVRERRLLKLFGRKGKFDNQALEDDVLVIENAYRDKGYVNARVSEIERRPTGKGDHIDLVITIDEGQQHTVAEVTVSGTSVIPEDTIVSKLQIQAGQPYSAKAVREDIRFLQNYYGNKGYADINVVPQLTSPGAGLLNIDFSIFEGASSTVGLIDIVGNVKTQDRVIRRELAINPGEPFNSSLVRASESRLRQLPNFSRVDISASESAEPGQKDIKILVTEKPTGTVNFGAGFSSIDSIVGFVDVTQTNFDIKGWPKFTGAGQKFRMSLKYGNRRRDFSFDFTEPWLMGRKLSMTTSLYYRDIFYNSDQYDERHYGGDFSLRKAVGEHSSIKAGYRLDNGKIHNIDDDASAEIRMEEGDYLDSMVYLRYSIDTRDSFTLPRKGYKLTAGVDYSGLGGDVKTYGFELGGAKYYNLPLDTILSFEGVFNVVDAHSGRVPIIKRNFLGGARNLRGYDYREAGPKDENGEPLGGETSAYGTAEISIPMPGLEDKVRLATFYDIGTVSRDAWDFDEVYSDVGIGVRLFILAGAPIRLDYGYPLKTDEFTGSSGKFNFQMGWNF